jgi:hypothetical protein
MRPSHAEAPDDSSYSEGEEMIHRKVLSYEDQACTCILVDSTLRMKNKCSRERGVYCTLVSFHTILLL